MGRGSKEGAESGGRIWMYGIMEVVHCGNVKVVHHVGESLHKAKSGISFGLHQ